MSPLGWLALGAGIAACALIISLLVIALVGTRRGYVVAASFRYAPAPKPKVTADQAGAP